MVGMTRSVAVGVPVEVVYDWCKNADEATFPLLRDLVPRSLGRTVTHDVRNALVEIQESWVGMTFRKRFELRSMGAGTEVILTMFPPLLGGKTAGKVELIATIFGLKSLEMGWLTAKGSG